MNRGNEGIILSPSSKLPQLWDFPSHWSCSVWGCSSNSLGSMFATAWTFTKDSMLGKCFPEWLSVEDYQVYGVCDVVGPEQSCLAGTEQHSELREDDRKWTRQAKSSRKSFCSFVIAWESTTGSDCTLRRIESSFSSRATILLSSSSLRCCSSDTRSYIMFWVWRGNSGTVSFLFTVPGSKTNERIG